MTLLAKPHTVYARGVEGQRPSLEPMHDFPASGDISYAVPNFANSVMEIRRLNGESALQRTPAESASADLRR